MNKRHFNLGSLFEEVVYTYRLKPAMIDENGAVLSFNELNLKSNQFVVELKKNNIKKGDVVAIFNDKSFEAFALMIACIKIGSIYVNLDISNPQDRLNKIIARCNPKILFNFFNIDKVFDKIKTVFAKDIVLPIIENENSSYCDLSVNSNDPVYIMFTSGSTGFPKGATMSHANVLNFIEWGKKEYQVNENDVFTNVNPIYFDNSVFDFFVSVFNGASLLIIKPDATKAPRKLVSIIENQKPSIWFSVPSMLIYLITTKSINENSFASLRVITFGGEGFPKSKLKIMFDWFKNRIRFVNVYGPTECTCICSAYDINESDFKDLDGFPPIGKLASNFRYLLMDDNLQESKKGELLLMGAQVGLGYFNDVDRTNDQFIQNPINKFFKDISYRTGDLMELKADGKLYFIGRKDNQIKHLGYRIELEEIESALNSIIEVKESCVVYKKESNGMGQIIAYVSSTETAGDILKELKVRLPEYMIPRKVEILPELPKNKNGKIDRSFLNKINE